MNCRLHGRTWRVALAAVVVSLSACSIREDSQPQNIPLDQRGGFGDVATGDAAVGDATIYLLGASGPDEQLLLRAVSRVDATNPEEILDSLVAGANEDEITRGLSTAIPPDLEIIEARAIGTRLTIDINDSLNELSERGLREALAQIVATSSEIDRVSQVRLRVSGENQGWPTGDGEITDRPLTIYDYPGFLETSQPNVPALPLEPQT
jgi:spore germination protein GerM